MIFNGEMVRAILDGRKTQTRRIVSWRGLNEGLNLNFSGLKACEYPKGWIIESDSRSSSEWRCQPTPCPFGKVGDRIWVRETFGDCGVRLAYRADTDDGAKCKVKRWTPSIHMPRWASRITLEITKVRLERLQSISDEDVDAECFAGDFPTSVLPALFPGEPGDWAHLSMRECYGVLWKSIYGEESWQANPWVWVIEFKRVEGDA